MGTNTRWMWLCIFDMKRAFFQDPSLSRFLDSLSSILQNRRKQIEKSTRDTEKRKKKREIKRKETRKKERKIEERRKEGKTKRKTERQKDRKTEKQNDRKK